MIISITDFSIKYNLKKEYVISNLDGILKPYVVMRDGVRLIDETAINILTGKKQPEPQKTTETGTQQEKVNAELLRFEIKSLKEENERLKRELAEEKEKTKEYEKKMFELTDRVLTITENSQKLTAINQQQNQQLMIESVEQKTSWFRRLFTKKKPM